MSRGDTPATRRRHSTTRPSAMTSHPQTRCCDRIAHRHPHRYAGHASKPLLILLRVVPHLDDKQAPLLIERHDHRINNQRLRRNRLDPNSAATSKLASASWPATSAAPAAKQISASPNWSSSAADTTAVDCQNATLNAIRNTITSFNNIGIAPEYAGIRDKSSATRWTYLPMYPAHFADSKPVICLKPRDVG